MFYVVKWSFPGHEHVHESKRFKTPRGAMDYGCEVLQRWPPPSDIWIEDQAGPLIRPGRIKEHCRTSRPVRGGTAQSNKKRAG